MHLEVADEHFGNKPVICQCLVLFGKAPKMPPVKQQKRLLQRLTLLAHLANDKADIGIVSGA